MKKTKKAVKYMIDVWDEVTGRTWREKPDHVQQKFLEAEKELLNIPVVSNSLDLVELEKKIDEVLDSETSESLKEWLHSKRL